MFNNMFSETNESQDGNGKPDSNESTRRMLLVFALTLSLLGVVAFFVTGIIWIVVALNAPLLLIFGFYFPKPKS